MMMLALIRRDRMVAIRVLKLGIRPMLANSSSMQWTSRLSVPLGCESALRTRVSNRLW